MIARSLALEFPLESEKIFESHFMVPAIATATEASVWTSLGGVGWGGYGTVSGSLESLGRLVT